MIKDKKLEEHSLLHCALVSDVFLLWQKVKIDGKSSDFKITILKTVSKEVKKLP